MIIGLHDYLQRWHPGSTLVGFLGGPAGVMNSRYKVLTADELVRGQVPTIWELWKVWGLMAYWRGMAALAGGSGVLCR